MDRGSWRTVDRRAVACVLAALVVLVILVGGPAGRSPDADPVPTAAASPLQLCGSLERMGAARDELVDGATAGTADSIAELREAATRARTVGARTRGLTTQARAGLDYFTGLFLALPDRPTVAQLLSSGAPATVTDQAHADAFVAWLEANCPQTSGA